MTVLRFSLRMNPGLAEAHAELGSLLLAQGRVSDAIESFRTAVKLLPPHPGFHTKLAAALETSGEAEQAAQEAREALQLDPGAAAARSVLLRSMLRDPHVSEEQLLSEHLEWDNVHGATMRAAMSNYAKWEKTVDVPALPIVDRDPDRPLRLGFVSPDFRRHSLAKVLIPLLEKLDRAQFTVICYSDAASGDDVTQLFKRLANGWRDSATFTDTQLALRVREDRIDILIDLTGHGDGNRMLAFAQQPAPVQVTQFGYPFTTGLSAIGYRVSDDIADPPGGERESQHAGKLIRLPRPAICFRPWEPTPSHIEMRRATDPITFGCLADAAHLSPLAIETWATLMSRVPESRLLLMSSTRDVDATRARLTRFGIPPFRLSVLPPEPGGRYLDLFNAMDIVLDTFPMSGGTTAGDAAWMARPTVTLAADPWPASRRAAVFLISIGLADLIATTPQQYVEIATALANDRARLIHLAENLRATLLRSPVCDAAACAAAMMAFYRDAWRAWCASTTG